MSHYRTRNIVIFISLVFVVVFIGEINMLNNNQVAYAKSGPTLTPTTYTPTPSGVTPNGTALALSVTSTPNSTSFTSNKFQSQSMASTSQVSCNTHDMRGYWQFQDTTGVGNFLDSSSYGNHGSNLNAYTYKPGIGLSDQSAIPSLRNGSLGLGRNGNELPVKLTNNSLEFDSSTGAFCQITLEAWVKSSDLSGAGYHHIIDNLDAYALSIKDGRPAVMFRGSGNWWTPTNIPLLKPYQWYYIAATYDGYTETIYVNGQLAIQRSAPGFMGFGAGGQVAIGGKGDGSLNYPFLGTIDEVRVTARAMSASELLANYQMYASLIPLIFVPGFAGTELHDIHNNNTDDLIWMDLIRIGNPQDPSDSFLDVLKLGDDQPSNVNIRPTKVMRTVLNNFGWQGDIYDTFINYLTSSMSNFNDYHGDPIPNYSLGEVGNTSAPSSNYDHVIQYQVGENFWLFPSDFRVDMKDTAVRLDTLVNDVLEQTGSTQVNFVAHSQGGVIVREYVRDPGRVTKVNRLITIGSPLLGLPWAFQGLRYGSDLSIPLGILNPRETKSIVQHWPAVYQLLPSPHYFELGAGTYFFTTRDLHVDENGNPVNKAREGYVDTLAKMDELLKRPQLLDFAESTTAVTSYDSGLVTLGVQFQTNIETGWNMPAARELGRDLIVGSGACGAAALFAEGINKDEQVYTKILPANGDGTVPLHSADLGNNDPTVKVHYVKGDHMHLPNNFAMDVAALLTGNDTMATDFLATPADTPCKQITVIKADLSVTKEDSSTGNKTTGAIENSSDVVEDIPNSKFFRFLNNQVAILPDDGSQYDVTVRSTQNGTFDLIVQNWQGNNVTNTILYKDVPQNVATHSTLTNSVSGAPHLMVDTDGTGTNVLDISPSSIVSGNNGPDITPPVTHAEADWALENGVYTSNATITLTGIDEQSGILKTVYSLDGGATILPYTGPFQVTINDQYTIMVGSTDGVGNEEWPLKSGTFQKPTANPSLTSRVSVASDNTQGNVGSEESAISANGRYIVFDSSASNLVADDTNNKQDIFLRDAQESSTIRISVSSNDLQANDNSYMPNISTDGRYVVFESDANNLVEGDTNSKRDIFLYDVYLKTTTLISVSSSGIQSNLESFNPSISADGRYIVFESLGTTLVSGVSTSSRQIFLRDTFNKITTCLSIASNGVQGNSDSDSPTISSNGRFIGFRSNASNLVIGDTNNKRDVFLRDTQTNSTSRISLSSSQNQADDESGEPTVSADGHYVAFMSAATNLVTDDYNLESDIFLRDTQTNTTIRVSVNSNGLQVDGYSHQPSISDDGRFIAFMSTSVHMADDLPISNELPHIFIHDQQTGKTKIASLDSNGNLGQGASAKPAISKNGRYIVFLSDADNLVSNDTNNARDIFRRENGISISGNIHTDGAVLSYIDGGVTKTTTSQDNGLYFLFVSYNWSGTVTPFRLGDSFSPASKTYSNLTSDQNNQDYLSALGPSTPTTTPTPIITPTATPTFTLTPTKTFTATPTATLTPTKTFTPTSALPIISGNAGAAWVRLRYYDGSYKTVIADSSGNYSFTVSLLWSGTITPSHQGYTFSPASRSYTTISADQTAQNYTSTMVKAVSAGYIDSCQLNETHNLACWGQSNWNSPLGTSQVFAQVSVGSQHGCAITNNGNVYCWGFLASISPSTTDTFLDISATGHSHSCGVKDNGAVLCWGNSLAGETTPPSGTFLQVSTGLEYTCGIKTDNTLICWGNNAESKSTPPSGSFAQVSTGYYHACALKNDGSLACWGRNASGESTPPSGTFLQVSAGAEHACAIKSDGTLACWGSNTYGQSTPPSGSYIEVSAGVDHTCAIKNDSTLTCWGRNHASQANPVHVYGYTGVGSASLSYMDGMSKTITSDAAGYYSLWLPYDWSGTVTPAKSGFTFSPASRSYSHITISPSNPLNYTATTTVTYTSIDADDGWILESSSTPDTGGSNDSTTTLFNVGDNASNLEYRSIISFDTSSIPDNATMVTATLRFKQGGSTGASLLNTYNLWVDMARGRFGSAFVLQNMDFDAAAVSYGLDNAAYLASGSTLDANSWFSVNLNTTARGFINRTNKTQFRFHFGQTTNNSTANILKFYTGTADNIANGFAPQLIITYSLP